jgi:hypothetical protein
MEAKPNPHNPLCGEVTGIVAAAVEYDALALDVPILEIETPAPGLLHPYQRHGFTLAFTRAGIRLFSQAACLNRRSPMRKTITPAQGNDARAQARARMLTARNQVRTWFSPESRATIDPDTPEVVGVPARR